MFPKSIRWRLQVWQAFLLISILSGFGVTAYQLNRIHRFRQIDEELQRRVTALSGDVRGRPPFGPPGGRRPFEPERGTNAGAFDRSEPPGPPPFEPGPGPGRGSGLLFPPRPGPEARGRHGWPGEDFDLREIRLSARTASLFDPTETNDFYYAIWSRGGNVLKRSTNAPADLPYPLRLDTLSAIHTRTRADSREAFQFTEIGECVLTGRPIASDLDALRRFAGWLVVAGGAVLALGLGGGWLLAGRALRPVEDISAAASRISVGNLAERIDVAETDSELGRLAGVLNSTFARLEAAFAQQKQFVADASHELRTPIAVLISEAQTTLARQRSQAEYREAVQACLDTAQQMRGLTQSLLELARYDAGQEPITRQPVDVAALARACVERLRPLAAERAILIHSDLASTEVPGDVDRLRQVITNLIANAIHYNKDGGEVRIGTRAEKGVAVVVIADTGEGIAPEDLPRIFERFYRADKARGRASGRSGLGLAICKAIVEAHGGTIGVSSEPGVGSTFQVTLPLQ